MTELPDNGRHDGRLNEVLAAYLEAADAGWAPDRQQFVTRYPELADQLESYFRDQDNVARLADSLPHPSPRVGQAGGPAPAGGDSPTIILPADPTQLCVDAAGTFGDYELRGLIQQGGMGVVVRAYNKRLEREEALKMIRTGPFACREEVRRFIEEARHNATLDHPNIVPVYDAGEHRGQPYFTMKLVEGGDMGKNLPRLRADLKGAVRLLAQVARAVHFAHQRGILHRDLKPANVLLEGKPDTPVGQLVPLVSDFGLAKRIKPTDAPQLPPDDAGYVAPEQFAGADTGPTAPPSANGAGFSAGAGTPGFIPPEQAWPGKDKLTTAADVYALGAILYKLLTGRPPFQGANRTETITQVIWHKPEPPRKLEAKVNRDLEAVCLKCLQKQPEERYHSALEVAEELERWGRKEPVKARPRSWPVRAWHAACRHALVTTIASALMVLIGFAGGGFAAYYWLDPDRPRRDDQKKLVSGKPVTLIGETGPPRYSRLVPWDDNDVATVSASGDKPFSFGTVTRSRLELLSNVPVQGYRFSAKVRHDRAVLEENGAGSLWETGIYFAYTSLGEERYWCELAFADRGISRNDPRDKGKNGRVRMRLQYWEHKINPPSDRYIEPEIPKLQKFPPEPGAWRALAVEVKSDSIRAFWGEGDNAVLVCQVSPADLQMYAQRAFAGVNNLKPKPVFQFAPQGGLGIFVNSGVAAFRDVVIEPLP